MNKIRQEAIRVALATFLSPLALYPALLVGAIFITPFVDADLSTLLGNSIAVATFGLFIAYPMVLLYGLPLCLILSRLDRLSYPVVFCASLIPVTIVFLIQRWDALGWAFFAYCSVSVSTVFWYLCETPTTSSQCGNISEEGLGKNELA